MTKYLSAIKNFLLTVLGIVAIVEIYRRLTTGDTSDLDVETIEEKIKQGEDLLKEIDNEKPSIDAIIDDWNSK